MSASGRALFATVAVLLAGAALAAPPAPRPSIQRVERSFRPDTLPPGGSGLFGAQLPKFADASGNGGLEIFEVVWRTPPAGMAAGTLVTFEYLQPGASQVKFLFIKHAFPVQGNQAARFEVARRGMGPVTAWRARVVRGGRLLAERRSESWR